MGERSGLWSRYRNGIWIGLLVAFTAASPFVVYRVVMESLDRMGEQGRVAELEARARVEAVWSERMREFVSNLRSGTTPEKVASVSIGMMADEVQSSLGLPHTLGLELPPYSYRYEDHTWVPNDIPIRGAGYIQAVFIDERLVGLGSLDPKVGRLCGGGCLDNMLRDERPWLDGLPYQVGGTCPVCGSTKRVPVNATLNNLR